MGKSMEALGARTKPVLHLITGYSGKLGDIINEHRAGGQRENGLS